MTINLPDEPTPHLDAAIATVRAADTDGRIDLARVLVLMITAAGRLSQWDSETIEGVLAPALVIPDVPTYGTADDRQAHRYWAAVAEDLGWDHDYEPEQEDTTDA